MTDPNRNEVYEPGGKLGPRLARIIADASVYTRQRLAPTNKAVAAQVLTEFTNHISDELRPLLGPIFREVAENPDTPKELRPLFQHLAESRGQAFGWLLGQAGGAAISAGLFDVFNAMLAPVTHRILQEIPNKLLSPETVAAAIARRLDQVTGFTAMVDESLQGGLNPDRLQVMIELARTHPAPGELLVMFNRNDITQEELRDTLQRIGFDDVWQRRMQRLAHKEFTLPDISALWNRNIITDGEARKFGAREGWDADQVRRALELGGEPLATQELGDAFRRGIIDRARFNRGIVQGPLRNEWFDVLEALQFSRMSTADAAEAVNQGHMELSEGRRIAHENGLIPDDFETLILTAGQPPGIEFATEAWNRGFIGRAQFREMFLESRIKNKYLPLLEQMRTRIIPQETVRLLYRNGVYSREKTLETLLAHGFVPDDAAALLALEDTRQDETTRELTRSQIVAMYEDQILDAAITRDLLQGMGYSETNTELMMALADVKRIQRFVNAAITRVRSAYLAGRIDESEVSIQLDALRVPAMQRDELIAIWEIDRQTVTKTLTASQIRQAFNKNLITHEDSVARLLAQGYDSVDADLFLQLTA